MGSEANKRAEENIRILIASLLLTLLSEISNRRNKVGFMPLNMPSGLGVWLVICGKRT